MKNLKILKLFFFLFFFAQLSSAITIAALPWPAQAADNYNSLDYTPQIQIPVSGSDLNKASTKVGSYNSATGVMTSDLLARYIKALYDYGMIIGGILAAIVLMGGGVLWLISAGDPSKINQAKELISGSLVGTVILFSSWLILNTVNPDLLKLQSIKTQVVKVINMVCCQYDEGSPLKERAELTTDKDCAKNGGKAYTSVTDVLGNTTPYSPDSGGKKCSLPGCCIARFNGDPNGEIMKCTNSMHSNCHQPNYFMENKCSEVINEMAQRPDGTVYNHGCIDMDKCATFEDGKECDDSSDGYCYNKICWTGKGQIGEPCGNELYSKCDADEPQGGRTCQGDSWGRSCVSDVWCCKFKSNGQRLNK